MQVAPEPAEVAEYFVDFLILDLFVSERLLFLCDLRDSKNRESFRRRSVAGSFAPASVPLRLHDDHRKPRFHASAFVVLRAVFCSLLEDEGFQRTFSVFL